MSFWTFCPWFAIVTLVGSINTLILVWSYVANLWLIYCIQSTHHHDCIFHQILAPTAEIVKQGKSISRFILYLIHRTWSGFLGLSQRCSADALVSLLVLLLLLYVAFPRTRLPVLYHGGLHHCNGGWIPQIFEVKKTHPLCWKLYCQLPWLKNVTL